MAKTKYERITSFKNPRIQFLRTLVSEKNFRTESGLYPIEGIRLAEEAIQAKILPETVYFTKELSGRGLELIRYCDENDIETIEVSSEIMERISDTETAQGLLMVLPQQSQSLPPKTDLVLIVDQLRDPGNMGTLLRSAAAAAVRLVLITPGSVDVYLPKVVRSAMGAHFRLCIQQIDWADIFQYCKVTLRPPLKILLADSGDGASMWDTDLKNPLALVVGGEAEGASQTGRKMADFRVHIPMPGGFESLNAGVAASVLLFEILRQRTI